MKLVGIVKAISLYVSQRIQQKQNNETDKNLYIEYIEYIMYTIDE